MAQGACMALEDAVTLGEALRVHGNDWAPALDLYQRSRVPRTARIVLSGREMGRIYHAKGVERLVRNDLWKGRTPERFYDALEWLYGWNVGNCLAATEPEPGPERHAADNPMSELGPPGRPAAGLPRRTDAAQPGAAVAQPARRAAAGKPAPATRSHLLVLRTRCARCCCAPAS
jgi:hypothetical protein